MPELAIAITGARPVLDAVTPTLALAIRVQNKIADERIQSLALHCQIRIDAPLRPYAVHEQPGLRDLFGEPARWGRTLKSFLWTHVQTTVPSFTESAQSELLVPCTFDFNIASTKYLHALQDGDVPLALLFSGSAFYESPDGGLQVAPIPWTLEAAFKLPVDVWKRVIEQHYPKSAALWVHRDLFDRLDGFRRERGLGTLDEALDALLSQKNSQRSA